MHQGNTISTLVETVDRVLNRPVTVYAMYSGADQVCGLTLFKDEAEAHYVKNGWGFEEFPLFPQRMNELVREDDKVRCPETSALGDKYRCTLARGHKSMIHIFDVRDPGTRP